MRQNINMGFDRLFGTIICFFLFAVCINGQTGIGTTTPNASAKLDVYSTNKGFLPPRVTLTSVSDASTIASPAEGLLVYNIGSSGLQAGYYYWNGANWATIATATSAGNGVTSMDKVRLYSKIYSTAVGDIAHTNGYTFTVPVSGRYLFDFASTGYLNQASMTFTFKVRQGTTDLGTDFFTNANNNVHQFITGMVEVNLQAGVTYNVYVTTTGSRDAGDYDRVFYKLVAGNLPVTGQTVEYGIARFTGADTGPMTALGLVTFDAAAAGNLVWSGNKFTLKANKTYELESSLAIYQTSGGTAGRFQIYDYTNSNSLANGLFISMNGAGTNSPNGNAPMKCIVTPSTDIQVGIRLLDFYGAAGPGVVGSTFYAGSNSSSNASYFLVKQIGSSAIVNPWVLSGNDVYNTTGKVGIGNILPTQALDVTGSGRFSTSIINSGSRTYFGKDGANLHWLGTTDAISEPNNLAYGFESNGSSIQSHKWYVTGAEKMKLINTGKLGLGTSTPGTIFHIENGSDFGPDPSNTSSPSIYVYNNNNISTNAHASALIRTNGNSGGNPYLSFDIAGIRGYSIGIDNADADKFKIQNNWNFINTSAPAFTITTDNRVGLGTASPSATLHVASSVSQYVGSYGYLNSGGANTYTLNGYTSYSIQADQRIRASEFNAISDFRIKKNVQKLDIKSQLKVLNKLHVVSYDYIDQRAHGDKHKTGFIAQEVEAVNNQFVHQSTDFIPSVFSMATSVVKNMNYTEVTTDKPNGFKKGDIVKLFAEGKKEKIVTIDEIKSPSIFQIKVWDESTNHVFIYGKKVTDFRAIDFDQITALSVAAIQELAQQIEKLKLENESLQQKLILALQRKQAELELRIKQLELKSQ